MVDGALKCRTRSQPPYHFRAQTPRFAAGAWTPRQAGAAVSFAPIESIDAVVRVLGMSAGR